MTRIRKKMNTASSRGFTLLEVLVSVSILGVVTAIGTQSFVALTTSWNETRAVSEMEGEIDSAFDVMDRDIRDILSANMSGVSIIGESREAQNQHEFEKASNANDRMVLPVQGIVPGHSLQINSSVQYAVSRGGLHPKLERTEGALGETHPARPKPTVIIPNANTTRMRIEYATGDTKSPWATSWDKASLPKAIRVSLTVASPDKPWLQVSRKRVFNVHVE